MVKDGAQAKCVCACVCVCVCVCVSRPKTDKKHWRIL